MFLRRSCLRSGLSPFPREPSCLLTADTGKCFHSWFHRETSSSHSRKSRRWACLPGVGNRSAALLQSKQWPVQLSSRRTQRPGRQSQQSSRCTLDRLYHGQTDEWKKLHFRLLATGQGKPASRWPLLQQAPTTRAAATAYVAVCSVARVDVCSACRSPLQHQLTSEGRQRLE